MSGEVDFGLINDPGPIAELQLEPILTEPFEPVCAPDHRLAGQSTLSWQDLNNEPLILLDRGAGSRRLIDEALSKYGVQTLLYQDVGHATTIVRMVMAGLGLFVVPQLAIPRPVPPGLVVRPIFPRVERRAVLARRARRALSPQAEVVWTLIRDVAAGG